MTASDLPDLDLPEISDDDMRAGMATTRPYSIVVLRTGPHYADEGARDIIWEHGRRNYQLRAAGLLAIVCPIPDDSDLAGVGVFTTDPEQTERIMADDPAVRAGVLVAEVHPSMSFPGDALPPS